MDRASNKFQNSSASYIQRHYVEISMTQNISLPLTAVKSIVVWKAKRVIAPVMAAHTPTASETSQMTHVPLNSRPQAQLYIPIMNPRASVKMPSMMKFQGVFLTSSKEQVGMIERKSEHSTSFDFGIIILKQLFRDSKQDMNPPAQQTRAMMMPTRRTTLVARRPMVRSVLLKKMRSNPGIEKRATSPRVTIS